MKPIEEFKNKIICGDALGVLKEIPDESIDMVITSPPYYALRNYQVGGQIGLESTFEEYLKKILDITAEIKRVLKKSGSFWLNLGDVYGGVKEGKTDERVSNYIKENQKGIKKNLPKSEKCLAMMPERIAIAMIDQQGWILRNKIKWAKQVLIKKENRTMGSVMPTSVKDRFNESGEELYLFVKNKKYYSDLDAVRLSPQTFENRPDGITRSREYGYDSKYLNNYSPQNKQSRARTQRKSLEARMEDTKNIDQKSSRTYNIKKLLSEVRLGIKPNTGMIPNKVNDPRGNHEGGPGSWRDFKDENHSFTHPLGKNLPTIWLIGSEPHNFKKELNMDVDHFAIFPQALLEIPIKFGCPKNGIVLDPFMGSGTTAIMAKKLGRNYIGIELNPEYIKIAETRIKKECPNDLFNS